MHACVDICMMFVCVCACVRVRGVHGVCVFVCMYVCMYVSIHTVYMHTYSTILLNFTITFISI